AARPTPPYWTLVRAGLSRGDRLREGRLCRLRVPPLTRVQGHVRRAVAVDEVVALQAAGEQGLVPVAVVDERVLEHLGWQRLEERSEEHTSELQSREN